jgi:uncharacterized Fe-S radical SAM superfamily protein PflX
MSRSLLFGQLRRELLSNSVGKADNRSAVDIAARPSRLRRAHGAPSLAAVVAVQRRRLHLAPPFLLDEPYIPRSQKLSAKDAALKRSRAYGHLRNCNLCPRLCGVNRYETTGMCLIGDKAKVNVIAPHFGEGMLASLLLVLSAL